MVLPYLLATKWHCLQIDSDIKQNDRISNKIQNGDRNKYQKDKSEDGLTKDLLNAE